MARAIDDAEQDEDDRKVVPTRHQLAELVGVETPMLVEQGGLHLGWVTLFGFRHAVNALRNNLKRSRCSESGSSTANAHP